MLSVGIGIFNFLMYLFLLQFQIASFNETAYFTFLILGVIPVQFIMLALVAFISKKNKPTVFVTSGLFIVTCFLFIWFNTKYARHAYRDAVEEKQLYHKTEQKEYNIGISTPEGYPIKLMTNGSGFSVIIDGKGYHAGKFKTNKVYSENWGNGPSDGLGIAIPDSLKLYWFSFLENKYYGLSTKLDKTKISDYFKKGYQYDRIGNLEEIVTADYQDLLVGIAPGGDVVLWISSSNDTREINVFKAKEINPNQFKSYYIDLVEKDEIKTVLSDTCTCIDNPLLKKIVHQKKPINFGIWTEKYRKKFNWKVAVNTLEPIKSQLKFYFYNGERFSFYNERISSIKYQRQLIPEGIVFTFFENKKRYKAYFEFDEDEIFNNFKKLTQSNPNEPIDIVLNINPNFTTASIELKSKDKTLNFEKMKTIKINAN